MNRANESRAAPLSISNGLSLVYFREDVVNLLAVAIRLGDPRVESHQRAQLVLEWAAPEIVQVRIGRGEQVNVQWRLGLSLWSLSYLAGLLNIVMLDLPKILG